MQYHSTEFDLDNWRVIGALSYNASTQTIRIKSTDKDFKGFVNKLRKSCTFTLVENKLVIYVILWTDDYDPTKKQSRKYS